MLIEPHATLRVARALISDPAHWTTTHFAETADGRPVDPGAPDAVRWCLLGAIQRAGGSSEIPEAVLGFVRQRTGVRRLACFNDTHAHADVLGLLDTALQEGT